MTKNKFIIKKGIQLLLLFIFFLSILISMRLLWIHFREPLQTFTAEEGTIQLTSNELKKGKTIQLNGEWEFFPNELLKPEQLHQKETSYPKVSLPVPGKWDMLDKDHIQFGTYRLQIEMDDIPTELSALRLNGIYSAFELFINGELVGGIGEVSQNKQSYQIGLKPFYPTFSIDQKEVEIVLLVANDTTYRKMGGITKPIIFGNATSIEQLKWSEIIFQSIVAAIFLSYLLYIALLYSIGIREKIVWSFSSTVLFTALSILIDNERILLSILPLDNELGFRLIHFFYIGTLLSMLKFILDLFPDSTASKSLQSLIYFSIAYMISFLIFPIEWISIAKFIFNFLFVIYPILSFFIIVKIAVLGKKGAYFLLFAATAVGSSILGEYSSTLSVASFGYYPFDMVAAIIALSAFWFQRYFHTTLLTTELSRKLQREIDRKDDFLANTSHELRNPLHGILNIAQSMLDQKESPSSKHVHKNIELLISIGNHMTFVVDDLLDLTKLKEQTLKLQKQNIEIEAIIRTVCDMMRFSVQGKEIEMVIQVDETLSTIYADKNRMMQILFNLLHNAIKFTPKGTITISAKATKNEAIFCVDDSGLGIPPELLPTIFDRYEQQDASLTAMGNGLGIGLAICKELIELHGGTIHAESIVNVGTTIRFTLPLVENVEVHTSFEREHTEHELVKHQYPLDFHPTFNPQPKDAGSGFTLAKTTRRLLIVDDDLINLQTLSQVLTTENYEIETAQSGKQALKKLQNNIYHLIITDIMMPQMSGYELVSKIRQHSSASELPILVLTARSRREDMLTAFKSGANDYVTKPVDAIELKARVHSLISLQQSIEERLRLEAAWLQAQINPHFFFNVLNSIIMLSDIDEHKMHHLLDAFRDFLSASFDFENTEIEVPIEQELDLVRAYLTIEQIRFENRIKLIWEIDEALVFLLPPLTIQTLVENAIKHGILTKAEGGTIHIIVQKRDDTAIIVSIQDNGVGFDTEQQKEASEKRGIGIPNTDFRLKQLYGTGLHIKSNLGEGTTVSFEIPIHK